MHKNSLNFILPAKFIIMLLVHHFNLLTRFLSLPHFFGYLPTNGTKNIHNFLLLFGEHLYGPFYGLILSNQLCLCVKQFVSLHSDKTSGDHMIYDLPLFNATKKEKNIFTSLPADFSLRHNLKMSKLCTQ